ncbi:MAG: sialidase [Desulfuromonadales bacterium]|nr:sialidase [Desulfuromonadales bacterium]
MGGPRRIFLLLGSLIVVASLNWSATAAASMAVKARLVERSLLLAGSNVNGLTVAVGERGHILRSEDNGRSWQQAEVPTRATLTGVFFHDKDIGWAVGHDQTILKTTDGGKVWKLVHAPTDAESPLLDVWFADSRNGYAVGAYGTFLETGDGGESWRERRIAEEDFHLNQIVSAGGERLFIAAEAGKIMRSEDGGKIWALLPPPYTGSFFGALPLGAKSLLIFGLRGHLFRSDDAGESWKKIPTGTEASLTDGLLLADGTIVIAGLAGTLLISLDQGQTFFSHQQSDRKGFTALLSAGAGQLVGVGEFGVKQLSINSILTVK